MRSKHSSTTVVRIHIQPGQLYCSAAAGLVYYYCTCMSPLTKTGTYYDKKNSFSTEVRETAMQQAQQYAAKYSIVVLNVLVVKTARHVGCSCAKKTHHNGSCSPGLVLGYTRIPFDVHTAVSSGLRVYLVTRYAVPSRFDCEPRAILGVVEGWYCSQAFPGSVYCCLLYTSPSPRD